MYFDTIDIKDKAAESSDDKDLKRYAGCKHKSTFCGQLKANFIRRII